MNGVERGIPARHAALLLGLALLGCAAEPSHPRRVDTEIYRAAPANRGAERYSAWFADSGGGVLYFGLSPFWELWWASDGDALADLREPGDHLIGRFDLAERRFLAPLRVRDAALGARASVWDVLAHSNGRIYYTTFFEEFGWVEPESGAVRHIEGLGVGLNELAEGPAGNLYVTRYSTAPRGAGDRSGSLLVLTPDGDVLRETHFEGGPGEVIAPKSVAVDPESGECWLTADVFASDGSVGYGVLHVDASGRVLARRRSAPELLFARFDARGYGYFVEDVGGTLRLRITEGGRDRSSLELGPRWPLDYAQDIQIARDSTAVIAFWSGRVDLVRLVGDELSHRVIQLEKPRECAPPRGRSLVYTAVLWEDRVYATLTCGAAILAAELGE